MNKKDITDNLASKGNITKVLANSIVNILFESITDSLVSGEKVVVSDFGTFTISSRKGFTGVNPRTGNAMEIPGRLIPVFRSGKALKQSLNKD